MSVPMATQMALGSTDSPRCSRRRPVGVDHLRRGHVGHGVRHPARHAVLVERHQRGVAEAEERQLVPVGPDQQVDAGRGAVGDRGQRMIGQQDAVDDRKERQRDHPRVRAPLAHLFGGGHEFGRRNALQCLPAARRDAQHSRQPISGSLRLLDRVHVHAAALHDGAAEEPFGGGRSQQRGHAESAGGLAEDGDAAGIAAEGRDVVPHPPQRGDLVLQAPVPDQPVRVGQVPVTEESQGAEPVVDGDDHGVAVAHQVPAPVEEDRSAARGESTPVDEDHDRAALPGLRVGESGSSGVQTFSERQSSLCGSEADGSEGLVMPGTAADCGAIGPNVDASRTSLHDSASNGGRHRNAPIGARAYGIPENDQRSPRQTPLSLP